MPTTIHARNRKLKMKLNRQQLLAIGLIIVKDFRDSRGVNPTKVQFFIKPKKKGDLKKGKRWYWWICEYPDDYIPRIDEILREQVALPSAATQPLAAPSDSRKRRPRINRRLP